MYIQPQVISNTYDKWFAGKYVIWRIKKSGQNNRKDSIVTKMKIKRLPVEEQTKIS